MRYQRRTRPRAKTIAAKRFTREAISIGRILYPPVDVKRPEKRGDCAFGARPCPWVACRHNLYLEVNENTGSIKFNFPEIEPWEMGESCALDVARYGGVTLEEVGQLTNLTRERVRQIEEVAMVKVAEAL